MPAAKSIAMVRVTWQEEEEEEKEEEEEEEVARLGCESQQMPTGSMFEWTVNK